MERLGSSAAADVAAPRWWAGPLSVEGLALEAVGHAIAAVDAISDARRIRQRASTTPALVAASFSALDHLRVAGQPATGWAPFSGFFRAHDGWVRLHGNYPHHSAAIASALGVTDQTGLVAAVADRSAEDVEASVWRSGGVAARVRTSDEWARHPHAASSSDDPWWSADMGAVRAALPSASMPLAGVRVLDLTRVIAGPTCSQLLGCLGADVLRIDPPHRPELLDQFISNGMCKRSAVVDLADSAQRIRAELLPIADVVLLGYRPRSLARFGLDTDALRADFPNLVVGSLSAWGERGPWSDRPGFDSIVQAAVGIATTYSSGGKPGALPVQALDHATGYILAAGVMDLLAAAHGGVVRASLLGAARHLFSLERPVPGDTAAFEIPSTAVGSPYGEVLTVAPAVRLGSIPLTGSISGYGAAALSWAR